MRLELLLGIRIILSASTPLRTPQRDEVLTDAPGPI